MMDMDVRSANGATPQADGRGLADDASRRAVLTQMMTLLPAYL